MQKQDPRQSNRPPSLFTSAFHQFDDLRYQTAEILHVQKSATGGEEQMFRWCLGGSINRSFKKDSTFDWCRSVFSGWPPDPPRTGEGVCWVEPGDQALVHAAHLKKAPGICPRLDSPVDQHVSLKMTYLHLCIRTPGTSFPGLWSVFSHVHTVILPMLSHEISSLLQAGE